MARRIEFKSVCHDLIETFTSRYNDSSGYWSLGKYMEYLLSNPGAELRFDLGEAGTEGQNSLFAESAQYYPSATRRMMKARGMAPEWLAEGAITVGTYDYKKLLCACRLVSDRGRVFLAFKEIPVWPHDPSKESRRGGDFGPSNQVGI